MPDYIRVTWKAHGHESSIPAHRFDPERHAKADKPAADASGNPLPDKHRTSKGAKSRKATAQQTATDATPAPDENGQQAETQKEND